MPMIAFNILEIHVDAIEMDSSRMTMNEANFNHMTANYTNSFSFICLFFLFSFLFILQLPFILFYCQELRVVFVTPYQIRVYTWIDIEAISS